MSLAYSSPIVGQEESLTSTITSKPELLYEQPMMPIYTYLGRQEVINLQHVSQKIRHIITTGPQALSLWQGYAQRLKLDVAEAIDCQALIKQVRDYYQPRRQPLFATVDPNFEDFSVRCCNFYGSIVAGCAFDCKKDDLLIAALGRWDQKLETRVMEPLGIPPKKEMISSANAINAKGTIFAGEINLTSVAAMWKIDDNSTKMTQQLLDSLYKTDKSRANAISADGTIIAGLVYERGRSAAVMWEWDDNTMRMKIQALNSYNETIWSKANAISADDTIITGSILSQAYRQIAVFWKRSDRAIQTLGGLHGGAHSESSAISADGTVIAGWAYDGKNLNRKTAVMWKNTTITALDMPDEATSSWVTTISADGTMMAGQMYYGAPSHKSAAVVWHAQGQILFQEFIKQGDRDNIIVSGHGSDFFVPLENGKINKVHRPRYDLWQM